MVLALTAAACSDSSGGASKATASTISTGASSAPASGASQTDPVTEADVAEVDQVLRRLDGELDRLDSDLATGEGETQQEALRQVVPESARRVATAAITRRVLALRERITASKFIARLSDADRSALTTQLQDQVNGLTNLNARIQGDLDEATLRADAQRIVTDYRVYVLTIPKSRGIVVADIELGAGDRLTKLADRLAAAVEQAKAKDAAEATADLASLRNKLATVASTIPPLPGQLLALEPAGYPANHAALEQSRLSLRTGRSALADAATLARLVITDLE